MKRSETAEDRSSPLTREEPFPEHRMTPGLVFVLSLFAAFWLWHTTRNDTLEIRRIRFHNRVILIKARIQDGLATNEKALLGCAGLYVSSVDVERGEWSAYVHELEIDRTLPGVQGIGFARKVRREELASHIREIHAEGFPSYTVLPPGDREEYFPIVYLEPFFHRNLRAFGYDMFSEPVRREAMEDARDHDRTSISGKVTLVQETPGSAEQAGFLMYHPVFVGSPSPRTLEERRQAIKGFAYSPIRGGDFLDSIVFDEAIWVGVSVYDGESLDPGSLLYDSTERPQAEPLPAGYQPEIEENLQISIYGRTWSIRFISLPSFDAANESAKPFYVLIFGLFISALLTLVALVMRSRNRALNAARGSEARYRLIIEKTGQIVYELDILSGVNSYSGAIEEVLGFERKEFEQASFDQWLDGLHPEDRLRLLPVVRIPERAPGPFVLEYRFRRKDGEYRFILDRGVSLTNDQGWVVRILGTMTDISERKQFEDALRSKNAELEDARRAADKASQAKSEFVANVSHELRTPLNAVLGFSGLVLNTELSPTQTDYLRKIQSSALALLGIINDILDFSKIEAGKLTLENVDFRLDDVVETYLAMIATQATAKHLRLQTDFSPDIPKNLVGDPLRIGQILTNLLGNAVKFTEKGGIDLQITHRMLDEERVELSIRVRDTGIGMSSEQAARLFQPFVQGDLSTTRRYGGTGLGLTICKNLVESMGGRISLDTSPGQGTAVTFSVTCGIGQPDPVAGGQQTGFLFDPRDRGGLADLAVLLVEDNPLNQQITSELLGSAGVRFKVVGNGAEALSLLTGAGADLSFDLILMDIQMPEMDGYEATRRIRLLPRHVTTPIIAMTAHVMAEDREKMQASGMSDHVAKPITPQLLFRTLRKWAGDAGSPGKDLPDQPVLPSCELTGIPGIDVQSGLDRVAGNVEVYLKLLREFAELHRQDLSRIEQAVTTDNRTAALQRTHTLKGVAGSLSLVDIFQATAGLENALRQCNRAESEKFLRSLHAAFQRFSHWVATLEPPPHKRVSGRMKARTKGLTVPEIIELLAQAKNRLENNDLQAERILEPLFAADEDACPPSCTSDLEALRAAVTRLRYKDALSFVHSLLQKLEGSS